MTITKRADEKAMLKVLRALGGSASNPALKAELGWEDSKYDAVRQKLIDRGCVRKGKGQGGSTQIEKQCRILQCGPSVEIVLTVAAITFFTWAYITYSHNTSWDASLAAAGIALSYLSLRLAFVIYRRQAEEAERDTLRTSAVLAEIKKITQKGLAGIGEILKASNQPLPAILPDEADMQASEQDALEPLDDELEEDTDSADLFTLEYEDENRTYLAAGAIPLHIITAVVEYWKNEAPTKVERRLSKLVGAWRDKNRNGDLRGAPYVIVFKDNQGMNEYYRVTLAGRGAKIKVTELSLDAD